MYTHTGARRTRAGGWAESINHGKRAEVATGTGKFMDLKGTRQAFDRVDSSAFGHQDVPS